jgi:hypothetical protein
MMRRHLLSLLVAFSLSAHALQAQPRPMAATTLTTTDTTANSMLVGCAVGSTTCTGGVKAGAGAFGGAVTVGTTLTVSGTATFTQATTTVGLSAILPALIYDETDASTNERRWLLGADADQFVIQLQNTAATLAENVMTVDRTAHNANWVRWSAPLQLPNGAVGTPALSFTSDADTGLYRIGSDNLGVATAGTLRSQWTSTGAFDHAAALLLTGTQAFTSSSGVNNDVTLNATTTRLDITTSGGATNEIAGLTGGTDGRVVLICMAGGGVNLDVIDEGAGSTAANRFSSFDASTNVRFNTCLEFTYLGGSVARWARVF